VAQARGSTDPSTRPHLLSDPSRAPPIIRTTSLRPVTLISEFYHREHTNTGCHFCSIPDSKYGRDRQSPGGLPKNRPLPLQQTPPVPALPSRSRSNTLTRRHTTMTPRWVTSLHNQQQTSEHGMFMLESLTTFKNIFSPS
jgi:hypothetical protein